MSDEGTKAAPSTDTSDVRPTDQGSSGQDDGLRKPSDDGSLPPGGSGGGVREETESGDRGHKVGGNDTLTEEQFKEAVKKDMMNAVEACHIFAETMQDKFHCGVVILCETQYREGFHVSGGLNVQTTLGLLDLTATNVRSKMREKQV